MERFFHLAEGLIQKQQHIQEIKHIVTSSLFFCFSRMTIYYVSEQNDPLVTQSIASVFVSCFNMKKSYQISSKVSAATTNAKQTPEIPPRICVRVRVCVCVCSLYCQATRVDHPANEEQGPCGFVADQVEERPVHSVGEVSRRGSGSGAGVLGALRRHLHHHLVT